MLLEHPSSHIEEFRPTFVLSGGVGGENQKSNKQKAPFPTWTPSQAGERSPADPRANPSRCDRRVCAARPERGPREARRPCGQIKRADDLYLFREQEGAVYRCFGERVSANVGGRECARARSIAALGRD